MWRCWRLFGGPVGLVWAGVIHLCLVGYFVGVYMAFGALLWLVLGGYFTSLIIFGVIGIGLLWLARRGERYVAARCIRRYLNRPVEET